MKVRVLLFAQLKEYFQEEEIFLELPEGAQVQDVLPALCQEPESSKNWQNVLMFAINQNYVKRDALLKDGDEVALIPPVAGG